MHGQNKVFWKLKLVNLVKMFFKQIFGCVIIQPFPWHRVDSIRKHENLIVSVIVHRFPFRHKTAKNAVAAFIDRAFPRGVWMCKVYLCAVSFHLGKCSKLTATIGSDGAKNLRKSTSKFVVQLPHCIRNALCYFPLNPNGKTNTLSGVPQLQTPPLSFFGQLLCRTPNDQIEFSLPLPQAEGQYFSHASA